MKKPDNYELKQWLCHNTIMGLLIDYVSTSEDRTETEWTLIVEGNSETKTLRADFIRPLVTLSPDWNSVLQPTHALIEEVAAYEEFIETEADEYAEYLRLKKKFEGEAGQ